MKRLTLNREFAMRHLFVAALLAGMGGWFGYDGYVAYPSMTPEALYEQIEKSPPPTPEAAARVYAAAIPRQKQFMCICLVGAAIVGLGVLRAARFRFDFDGTGFAVRGGARQSFADVAGVDSRKWEKKGIMRLKTGAGWIVLDAWHHNGVKEVRELLAAAGKI